MGKKARILPFRLGAAAAEALTPSQCELYRWIADKVLGEPAQQLDPSKILSIPISNRDIQTHPECIYVSFVTETQRESADLFIVDLTSPATEILRGPILEHLVRSFRVLSAASAEIVLFAPLLPAEKDFLRKEIESLPESVRLTVVSSEGATLPQRQWCSDTAFGERYRMLRIAAYGNPTELMRLKLVRRLGHFQQTHEGEVFCTRFFYDGRYCKKEIVTLLEQRMDAAVISSKSPILYHCPQSPWLEEAIVAVGENRGIAYASLSTRPETAIPFSRATLVLDIIDTGSTLRQLLQKCSDAGVVVETVFSILSAGCGETVDGCRPIANPPSGQPQVLNFLMGVEQHSHPKKHCPMCIAGLRSTSLDNEDWLMLPAYDMWEMILEAGPIPERDVPKHRATIEVVPDFPRILQRHGAWIASKIRSLLQASHPATEVDRVIVCPDEFGSNTFAHCLRLLLGVSVIVIPRPAIDNIKAEDTDVWVRQLKSVADNEVVVMDEFRASGTTLKKLETLVERLGKAVSCCIVLADFMNGKADGATAPVYSLYATDWYSDGRN